MNVIDKILSEWSFRCHDGVVDINDPNKVSILNEILEEYNLIEQEEQSIDDKINAIISNLKDEEKEQIYKSLIKAKNKINKIKDKDDIQVDELIKFLIEEKQIPENLADYIVLKAKDKEQIDELNDLLFVNSISLKELRNKENKDLKKEAGDLIWINNVIGITSKSLAIGKGELLLAIMIKKAKLVDGEGVDLIVTDREVEIKQNDAIISEKGRGSGYQTIWTEDKSLTKNGEPISFKEKWLKGVKGKLSTWTPIFDRFKSLPDENKVEYVNDINTLLPKHGFTGGELSTQDFNNIAQLCKKIAYLAVGDYLKGKDLILMNSDLQYTILNNKEQILEDNNIYTSAAFIPRISYKKPLPLKENENLTEELTNYLVELFDPKGHFQQRTNERGKVLDILNLDEIPLKDYNAAEVKEKLKSDISNKIQDRATKILEKDTIPSSFTYEIGIKVLKPILVVDGKEYSLKLFAKSITAAKDGSEVEKDNVGTLYFATVHDDKATTLLLLNKEDDNELYFQIKKHAERKPGREDKEAKILTPPNYIYRINLDELMGNKEEQGPELVDPSTLPYKIRTDYRAGANFDHNQYGTGKIVNTSNGTGGKGDSRGKLDWIDVKYPKPFLKGGKLTDIRRFNDIITLASPLLAK